MKVNEGTLFSPLAVLSNRRSIDTWSDIDQLTVYIYLSLSQRRIVLKRKLKVVLDSNRVSGGLLKCRIALIILCYWPCLYEIQYKDQAYLCQSLYTTHTLSWRGAK